MRIAFWRAKTTKASEITSGRFTVDRLPAMTDERIWKGTGGNVEEIDVPAGPTAAGLAIFGDGSDGDHTVTAGYTSGPITGNALTRDAFFNDLTINNGVTLDTAGYRIFVKGTLTNNGTIERNGNDAVGLNSGAALPAGSLGGSGVGGARAAMSGCAGGGAGVILIAAKIIDNNSGVISANGGDALAGAQDSFANDGTAGGGTDPSLGGNGGDGGDSSGHSGGGGGVATAPTATKGGFLALPFALILKEIETTVAKIEGGGGGGSGAADDPGSAGGGGGGGGGCIVIVYNSATWGTEQVNGGSGAAGSGTGTAGDNGSAGTVIKIANA